MVAGQPDAVFIEVPVVWGMPGVWVGQRTLPPKAWIALGEANGTLRLEAVASNRRSAHPDNRGNLPPAMEIMAGPAHLISPAPLPRLAAALIAAGFPATISDNAGGYLCNELFYHLIMRNSATWLNQTLVMFLHVPPLGTPVAGAAAHVAAKAMNAAYFSRLGSVLLDAVRAEIQ